MSHKILGGIAPTEIDPLHNHDSPGHKIQHIPSVIKLTLTVLVIQLKSSFLLQIGSSIQM